MFLKIKPGVVSYLMLTLLIYGLTMTATYAKNEGVEYVITTNSPPPPPQETNDNLALIIQPTVFCSRIPGSANVVGFDFDAIRRMGVSAADYRFHLTWKQTGNNFSCVFKYVASAPLNQSLGAAFKKIFNDIQQNGYGPSVEYDLALAINFITRRIRVENVSFTSLTKFPAVPLGKGKTYQPRMGLPSSANFHWLIPYRSSSEVQIDLPQDYIKHTKDGAGQI